MTEYRQSGVSVNGVHGHVGGSLTEVKSRLQANSAPYLMPSQLLAALPGLCRCSKNSLSRATNIFHANASFSSVASHFVRTAARRFAGQHVDAAPSASGLWCHWQGDHSPSPGRTTAACAKSSHFRGARYRLGVAGFTHFTVPPCGFGIKAACGQSACASEPGPCAAAVLFTSAASRV